MRFSKNNLCESYTSFQSSLIVKTTQNKVTQQNAANAEESASASEELSAQAEQMKGVVKELIHLVGGNGNGKRTVDFRQLLAKSYAEVGKNKTFSGLKKQIKGVVAVKTNEVAPEHVIPFEDDFKDF